MKKPPKVREDESFGFEAITDVWELSAEDSE
jgi:hypothetical protein